MNSIILDTINNPADLRALNQNKLPVLAKELRMFMLIKGTKVFRF